jgi:hypothetical protein
VEALVPAVGRVPAGADPVSPALSHGAGRGGRDRPLYPPLLSTPLMRSSTSENLRSAPCRVGL